MNAIQALIQAGQNMGRALQNSAGNELDYIETPGDGPEESHRLVAEWEEAVERVKRETP